MRPKRAPWAHSTTLLHNPTPSSGEAPDSRIAGRLSTRIATMAGIGTPMRIGYCIEIDERCGRCIADLQKMAVAERREAEPTTGRRNEVELAVRQATIELLAESCRQ